MSMKKVEQRRIALGVVRSQLQRMGRRIGPFVPFKMGKYSQEKRIWNGANVENPRGKR